MNQTVALTHSLEDYLEAILQLETANRVARVKDIAEKLGVQMPSVTGALKALKAKKLINYEKNQFISLTDEGMKIAKTILSRHTILTTFLKEVLLLPPERAEELGCTMEHSFTVASSNRLKNLMSYVQNQVISKIGRDDWEKYWQLPRAAVKGFMKQFSSTVLGLTQIARDFWRLDFEWLSDAAPAPGQFITLRSVSGFDPLLRRPFAISHFEQNRASVLFQKRGKATVHLAELSVGDCIDVIGPLGHPFVMEPGLPWIIAGGIGLGPMIFLAQSLASKPHVFFAGARSAELLPLGLLKELSHTVICTDDGSAGIKGTVSDAMALQTGKPDLLYACGPTPMLKACHESALSLNVRCWVSMEQIMGCGVGACMACAVETVGQAQRYARVCKEGPVFDSRSLKWT